MAGSVQPYPTSDQTAYYQVSGTGDPALDGKLIHGFGLIDPNTGILMVPGAVTFTTLTINDGADVTEGAKADVAVSGDSAGTVSAKLRGVNKVLGNVGDVAWVSGNGSAVAVLKKIAGELAPGQQAMVLSIPVTVASDQPPMGVTLADGADTTEGLIADAAVTGDNTGTTSAKLRGANKTLGDVADAAWVSGNGSAVAILKRVASNLALGTKTAAASIPVTVASDQASLPFTASFHTRADTYTTVTAGTTVDTHLNPCTSFSLQVTKTGSVTSWTTDLEISLDGVTFTSVATHQSGTQANGETVSVVGKPALYFRSNTTALVLGGGTNVVVTILGSN